MFSCVYNIFFDSDARILHLVLEDFWTPDTLARFAGDLLEQIAAAARHGRFAMLSDSSRFPVQSPEVAQGFERLLASGAERHNGAVAIVVASVLNKLQAERSLRAPHIKVFLDADKARAWLAEQQRAA